LDHRSQVVEPRGHGCLADRHAIDDDTFPKGDQVWRCVETGTESAPGECSGDEIRGAALAVGSANVDRLELALRVAQGRQGRVRRFETELDLGGAGEQPVQRRLVGTRQPRSYDALSEDLGNLRPGM